MHEKYSGFQGKSTSYARHIDPKIFPEALNFFKIWSAKRGYLYYILEGQLAEKSLGVG